MFGSSTSTGFGSTSFGSTTATTATANYNPMKDYEVTSPPDDSVSSLAFSPSGLTSTFLVAGSWDNNVSLKAKSDPDLLLILAIQNSYGIVNVVICCYNPPYLCQVNFTHAPKVFVESSTVSYTWPCILVGNICQINYNSIKLSHFCFQVRCWEVQQNGTTVPKAQQTHTGPVLDVCWNDVRVFTTPNYTQIFPEMIFA